MNPEDYRRDDFSFDHKKLLLGGEPTGFSVVPETRFWRVRYPDGVLSEDFYNLTWAKQNCLQAALSHLRDCPYGLRKPVGGD